MSNNATAGAAGAAAPTATETTTDARPPAWQGWRMCPICTRVLDGTTAFSTVRFVEVQEGVWEDAETHGPGGAPDGQREMVPMCLRCSNFFSGAHETGMMAASQHMNYEERSAAPQVFRSFNVTLPRDERSITGQGDNANDIGEQR